MMCPMPALATNRKIGYEYECLEKFEAGLALEGWEVKSVREGGAKLEGSHIIPSRGGLSLIGANIAPYKKASKQTPVDPQRSRQLLMHAKEIRYLIGKTQEKGLTLVPYSIYTRGQRLKVEFWLARGKKSFEKRDKIKQRDLDREARRNFDRDL